MNKYKNIILNQILIKELLDYDKETGLLYWKFRDFKWFEDGKTNSAEQNFKTWNSRFATKEALGSLSFGYKHGSIFTKDYRAHRIIWLWMTGEWPKEDIDHINGIRSDNRWKNLRHVSRRENIKNSKIRVDNSTGYPGISLDTINKRLVCSIFTEDGYKYIGSYNIEDLDLAVSARKEAEVKYGYHKNHGRKQ